MLQFLREGSFSELQMLARIFVLASLPLALSLAATGQIATSNENGATGAYSNDIDSSFTSESRFGPRSALDDLRANVDRDREAEERLRQRQQRMRDTESAEETGTLIDTGLPDPITEEDLADSDVERGED
ncbi:hypothetical protein D1224_00125 [Henriciella barbarensis]|uniref:Uncharacterized protein n=2 Tax=Henriciella barbarensis TaxID=86342 RepID=A0A399R752_9PROT|nr:hypothetical protein D1224_00125 [Henriciella barbarensis]